MNFDELLKNMWIAEESQSTGMENENTSSTSSLQRQASFTLARALSGKTVDEVWKEIQHGQKEEFGEKMKSERSEPALGEMTLEDFLVQAGIFSEASISPTKATMELDSVDAVTPQSFSKQIVLSSSPSIGILSDTTTSCWKRDGPDAIEKNIERRLRRKIKNRESAARSRTRKLAYHNELASKVSRLAEENIKLKKEKEFYKMQPCEYEESPEAKYQLRRTNSALS